ncbi:acyl carrier protein [Dongia mobilis]|uniref:Acyl carrier protein n=1 Tax=Dongia mobilis TaxID=578943 RepID=A0A4R6X1V6_9PROT|nr:phosphopantetheine-binding protein [Dongia mobilis]TDQ84448.1 acyl carrier protein [Dongia mobilis]
MTEPEIRQILLEEIGNVAPEIDLARLRSDRDLREELDIDSIGFLNLVIALGRRLGVEIAERDYPRLRTLESSLAFLAEITGPRARA